MREGTRTPWSISHTLKAPRGSKRRLASSSEGSALGRSLALSFPPETWQVLSSGPVGARWVLTAPRSQESKGDDTWTAAADGPSAD